MEKVVLADGWLERQIAATRAEVATWPEWMRDGEYNPPTTRVVAVGPRRVDPPLPPYVTVADCGAWNP